MVFEQLRDILTYKNLPLEIFSDQSFSDQAFIWTIGADKNADDRYNRYKSDLLKRYGDLRDFQIDVQPHQQLARSVFGPMLVHRHDMSIGPQIVQKGIWAAEELLLLWRYIKKGDTVIDIGANVGMHTLAFASWVGLHGTIHAFEPQRESFEMLQASITMNGWHQVFCHHARVGNISGSVHVPESDSLALDSLDLQSCHLIKIDAEGMEADILMGATALLECCRPLLYLSLPADKKQLLTFLKQRGYRIYEHDTNDKTRIFAMPDESQLSTEGLRLVDVSIACDKLD